MHPMMPRAKPVDIASFICGKAVIGMFYIANAYASFYMQSL